ncbi:hypothetical protein DdX_07346 [Ditylenchus destructor]|uniref:Uncharacterized protein n=1 Tax=Ditylenchus destructor TaxID=166010 RepID=A0AAD4N420_9BILA|nr:hypothetical protein DdX_07346 [Ditylenchus destructor]
MISISSWERILFPCILIPGYGASQYTGYPRLTWEYTGYPRIRAIPVYGLSQVNLGVYGLSQYTGYPRLTWEYTGYPRIRAIPVYGLSQVNLGVYGLSQDTGYPSLEAARTGLCQCESRPSAARTGQNLISRIPFAEFQSDYVIAVKKIWNAMQGVSVLPSPLQSGNCVISLHTMYVVDTVPGCVSRTTRDMLLLSPLKDVLRTSRHERAVDEGGLILIKAYSSSSGQVRQNFASF